MARKLHELKIDDTLTVVIKELKISEIKANFQLLTKMAEDGLNVKNLEAMFEKLVSLCLDHCTIEQFSDLVFSDAERIWNTFKEVNKSFFKLYSGTKNLLQEMEILEIFKQAIRSELAAMTVPQDSPSSNTST